MPAKLKRRLSWAVVLTACVILISEALGLARAAGLYQEFCPHTDIMELFK